MLYNLPLEMLDIILQKFYLHWILSSPTKQRDEEVIRSLISVDVCFSQRITRKRFKKAIWRYLEDFYGRTKKRSAIIRNNKNYLLEYIQPSDELIASLLRLNCITEERSHLIQRQCLQRDKNDELLNGISSLDEKKFSNFVRCLRKTKQRIVSRIMENGGVTIKLEVQYCGAEYTTSIKTMFSYKAIEDLRDKTKSWSNQTVNFISQMRMEDLEILNSQRDSQTVVVWIWCRSQAALRHIQRLYESNHQRDVLIESIQPSASKVINIDGNQFKKTVVVCLISSSFSQIIDVGRAESVFGVTTLRHEIYILCLCCSSSHVIRVFEDQNPFPFRKKFNITEIKEPGDIESSESENCLYVSDSGEKCVWKITRWTDNQYNITKWLTTDYKPSALAMSSHGQLLMVNNSSSSLMIYGSDTELIRSIQLSKIIRRPIHLVETSIGNYIILHYCWDNEEDEESWSSGRAGLIKWSISEFTRDGQMVVFRFIPSKGTQAFAPCYLSLDTDDRVLVADYCFGRVILLDSNLKFDRILCPTAEDGEEMSIRDPSRLCYDGERNQLIVGGGSVYVGTGANVYTISRQ